MTKKEIPNSGLRIGKLTIRGRTLRDLFNVHGPVVIDEVVADCDIGGDVVHAGETEPPPEGPASAHPAIKHLGLCMLGIAGAVAATGIAHAMGWG
jgi:hypothetical protein